MKGFLEILKQEIMRSFRADREANFAANSLLPSAGPKNRMIRIPRVESDRQSTDSLAPVEDTALLDWWRQAADAWGIRDEANQLESRLSSLEPSYAIAMLRHIADAKDASRDRQPETIPMLDNSPEMAIYGLGPPHELIGDWSFRRRLPSFFGSDSPVIGNWFISLNRRFWQECMPFGSASKLPDDFTAEANTYLRENYRNPPILEMLSADGLEHSIVFRVRDPETGAAWIAETFPDRVSTARVDDFTMRRDRQSVEDWCQANEYTDPFYQDNRWWAFPLIAGKSAVMPVELKGF